MATLQHTSLQRHHLGEELTTLELGRTTETETGKPSPWQADFSFFFDTGGRRRCYIAPERFYESDRAAPRGPLTPAADIFSLGCCIAEMFLDGTALFDLSQLLAYRRGEYDPSMALHAIEDEALKSMVLHMIQPAADMRLSAAEYVCPTMMSLKSLQLGAQMGARTAAGETPLNVGVHRGYYELAQVLRRFKRPARTRKAVARRRAQPTRSAESLQPPERGLHASSRPCCRRSVCTPGSHECMLR